MQYKNTQYKLLWHNPQKVVGFLSSNTTQGILIIVQINIPDVWWLCSASLHRPIHKIIRTFMGQKFSFDYWTMRNYRKPAKYFRQLKAPRQLIGRIFKSFYSSW